MSDLIDRQAAIEMVKESHECGWYLMETISHIEELPTIEERKKGKWIKMSDADGIYYACSECGEDIPRVSHYDPQFDLFPRLKSIEKTNFCPNCGADMRGGTDD